MNKIDKKQLPQLIALIALSVGVFGFFIYRMLALTPAAAQAPVAGKSPAAEAAKKVASAAPEDAEPAPTPEPTALMRDPFTPGVADPEALAMYQKSQAPAASSQPSAPNPPAEKIAPSRDSEVPPMPLPQAPLPNMGYMPTSTAAANAPAIVSAPPAPITWTVTGVMAGDEGVAILRDGENRRIVRQGDMLDGGLRVTHIARSAVILERDGQKYRLPLGGTKDQPAAKSPAVSDKTAAPSSEAPASPEQPAQPIAP